MRLPGSKNNKTTQKQDTLTTMFTSRNCVFMVEASPFFLHAKATSHCPKSLSLDSSDQTTNYQNVTMFQIFVG